MPDTIIRNLRDLTRAQIQVILAKAEIKGKGVFKPPVLDLIAIKARADELDSKSQTKGDIYLLIIEVEKLQKELNNGK